MTNSEPAGGDHWQSHSLGWELIGSPLRPAPDDMAIVATAVSELGEVARQRGLSVLILGVTPEYARFPWPSKTSLVACERSPAMIEHVWPGSTADSERIVQG